MSDRTIILPSMLMAIALAVSGAASGSAMTYYYGHKFFQDGQEAGEWKGKAETYESVMHLQTATMDALAVNGPRPTVKK